MNVHPYYSTHWTLGGLGATSDRTLLVDKLDIVMSRAEAEKTVSALEKTVAASATKAATKIVVYGLVASAALSLVTLFWKKRGKR